MQMDGQCQSLFGSIWDVAWPQWLWIDLREDDENQGYNNQRIMSEQFESWDQKVRENKELLLMYRKLHQVQESCWGRFFRFEQTSLFTRFDRNLTYRGVIRVRLDDLIYMVILFTICLVFALMPTSTNLLTTCYQYFLVFLWVFSACWLISPSGYRHCVLAALGLVFPGLVYVVYKSILPLDGTNSESIYLYGRFLTLWVAYVCTYVTYPIKQFIRNSIGSLYSYLFSLSFLTLFVIWPAYSLLSELTSNQRLTFAFITSNKPLLITFLIIVIFSFHLLVHHTFFEGRLSKVKAELLKAFSKGELGRAVHQLEEEDSCFTRNYQIYTRVMSGLVFGFTIGIQIYVFNFLTANLDQIINCLAIMIFTVFFLLYGCLINSLRWGRPATLFFFTLLCLLPAFFSPTFYSRLSFYQYVFASSALPYSTVFWCIIKSLSPRRPFFHLSMLVVLYIFLHVPATFLLINNLGLLSTLSSVQGAINLGIGILVGIIAVVGLVGFILWLCLSVKDLPAEEGRKENAIDYAYEDETNPAYVPYRKNESFSLAWLGSLDIRNLAELFSCMAFVGCQLATVYVLNELNHRLSNTQLASPSSKQIIYSQFLTEFLFFLFSFAYITLPYNSPLIYLMMLGLLGLGVSGLAVGCTKNVSLAGALRVGGAISLGLFMVGLALLWIKKKNEAIMKFLGGILVILAWVLLVIPYVVGVPIGAVYIAPSRYGEYIYGVILASTVLLVFIVSFMSLIFNLLMNKFEEEKKIKFMTEDVQVYLRDEGIEVEDEALHILYESYEHRDQRYVYFMRRGYPLRLYTEKDEKLKIEKTSVIVYKQEDLLKASLTNVSASDDSENFCWSCLTCLCGDDEQELQQRALEVYQQDEQEMQKLMPGDFLKGIFHQMDRKRRKEEATKRQDPSKFHSSKTITLQRLHKQARQLGPSYSLLKKNGDAKLAAELWHDVFHFFANQDDPPAKIIYNDFSVFCSILDLSLMTPTLVQDLYFNFARTPWKSILGLSLEDFALVAEEIAAKLSSPQEHTSQDLTRLLIEYVYPKMCDFVEFQDSLDEKKAQRRVGRERKMETHTSLLHDTSSAYLFEPSVEDSPFLSCFVEHQAYRVKGEEKRERLRRKRAAIEYDKVVEPVKEEMALERKEEKEVKGPGKSCKRRIFEKYLEMKKCWNNEEEKDTIKRQKIKPWDYLCVEAIRILEHKDAQWNTSRQEKDYEFRCILNNLLIAVLKLADLYTYLEITIMNPNIGWQSFRTFTYLIIEYRLQLYISFALLLLCFFMGIKGIGYIFEDRLGLTETRIPAAFPHPMFFFTFVYKLLILALFNTIIITLLSTFVCDWTSDTSTFYLILTAGGRKLQCFSLEHTVYLVCSIVGILVYYPMSAYTMPNFQFAEKRLDLKFKPSYLIIYFQVNFVLSAGKVLLSLVSTSRSFEVFFQSINIAALAFLCFSVLFMRPCLITWFNVVELLVAWIGLIWNVMGLVLLLTGRRMLSILFASSITLASLLIAFVYIRRRYFNSAKVEVEADDEALEELQMVWKCRKDYNLDMRRFQRNQSHDPEPETQKQGRHHQTEKNDIIDGGND